VHHAEVHVHFAALAVALARAQMWDELRALREWAAEWLFADDEDALKFNAEMGIDDDNS